MFDPEIGLSLHKLDSEAGVEALAAVEKSGVSTFEITAGLFQGEDGRRRKSAYLEMVHRSGRRTASVHARHGWTYDISSPDAKVREEALESALNAVELACDLDAPIVVLHASSEPVADEERRARMEAARHALRIVADRCGKCGRRMAVELLPRTCLGRTHAELISLTEGLDPAVVGFCLDTNHLMDRPDRLPGIISAMDSRLQTLHISDYDGVDEKHWLPGRGVVDWRKFMTSLRDIQYGGPFNFECSLEGATPGERLESLERTFRWMKGLIE